MSEFPHPKTHRICSKVHSIPHNKVSSKEGDFCQVGKYKAIHVASIEIKSSGTRRWDGYNPSSPSSSQ